MNKRVSARDAIAEIPNHANLGVCGFRWAGAPEALLRSLGEHFEETNSPRGLTLIFSSAQGDSAGTGLEHLAQPGLLSRVVGGFWGLSPGLCQLAQTNQIEAYNFPQGQICRLYSAIAAGQPGLLSRIGIDSFVDPRSGGGRLNAATTKELVEVVRLRGEDWLLYHSLPVNAAFIRGTTADPDGNLSFEKEAVTTEAFSLALATHNSGGIVIAQVERVVPSGHIPPRNVAVPGHVVDRIVVAADPATDHRQCVQSVYNPIFTDPPTNGFEPDPVPPVVRHIVAARAAQELRPHDVVNLGQGMPTDIVTMLRRNPLAPPVTFTIESGVVGGRPEPPPDFGIAAGPSAILRQDDQFTFYNGGGLDAGFLGFAEVDPSGGVNVSRFDGRLIGCGGFLDIAQTSKRLVFCGALTAGGLDARVAEGRLEIVREGRMKKFRQALTEKTFGVLESIRIGRPVTYVTERCVFTLTPEGLRLDEVAPGIDVRTQILDQMEFRPIVADSLKLMPLPARSDA